jgi:hypothetical protein
VQFFTNGQLTNAIPTSTSPFKFIFNCAFDAVGNLYVQGLDKKNHLGIGEIVGGARGNEIALLTTANVKPYPFYVQVTTTGQIAVGTLGSHDAVYTYNPPVGGSLGSPVLVTPITGSNDAQAFAFTKNMASLYVATIYNRPDFARADVQQDAYPAGGKALSGFHFGGSPDGIAVIPTQYPKDQK